MKNSKHTTGRSGLTIAEIRKRPEIAFCIRLKGAEKDFLADLMEDHQAHTMFDRTTVPDVIMNLLQQEFLRRNGEAQ